MCKGKTIRFFDDEERELVKEFCDLREREHAAPIKNLPGIFRCNRCKGFFCTEERKK